MKPFYAYTSDRIVVLIALLVASPAFAEPGLFAPERIGMPYWYMGGGGYTPDVNSQLSHQEGRFELQLGAGYRESENFAWGLDYLWAHQSVDTPATITAPFLGTVDPRSSLDTSGIAATAKFIFPVGRFEPYAGGGLGIYNVKFKATGQQLGFAGDLERNSIDWGFHFVAGADCYVTDKTSLGIEFRHIRVQSDLGNIAPGKIEGGGSFVSLVLRSAI